jgi:hypothetical protein
MHACMYLYPCMHVCIYLYPYLFIYVYTFTYTHTYTHTHISADAAAEVSSGDNAVPVVRAKGGKGKKGGGTKQAAGTGGGGGGAGGGEVETIDCSGNVEEEADSAEAARAMAAVTQHLVTKGDFCFRLFFVVKCLLFFVVAAVTAPGDERCHGWRLLLLMCC